MSGHSHYATIHRQKEVKDAQKGKIFSKLVRAISIAVKSGGGSDPNANYRLRMEVDQARTANMPKESIERAIRQAQSKQEELEEIVYEGYGPGGVAIIVEAATDNRNRTSQEIKNIFERGGGSLAGPGAVSFNFEPKGLIVVKKQVDKEDQMLKMIDLGVEDMVEVDSEIEVYVKPDQTSQIRDQFERSGFEVVSFELVNKPKTLLTIAKPSEASKILNLLDKLQEQDDVQKVFANLDIPQEVVDKINSGN